MPCGRGSTAAARLSWSGPAGSAAEVAASARQRGLDVTLIGPASVPLQRVLGPEIGEIYRDIHADHGVQMLLGTGVERFEGGTAVERVRTSDGRTVDCDFVVVGVGVQPRTALAVQAGIAVENGILADEHLQTGAPGVFAAGDVANAHHPFYAERIRVEHWANALQPGAARRPRRCSATTMSTTGCRTSSPISTTSEWSTPATRRAGIASCSGATREPRVHRLLAGEGRVVAGMNVNVWDVAEPIQALIAGGVPSTSGASRIRTCP